MSLRGLDSKFSMTCFRSLIEAALALSRIYIFMQQYLKIYKAL